jgi:prepilin-type N-terminal cleavage/methylation domain-containing protein
MIYLKKQSGFTLVETLVAITILLLVIIGPLTISSSSVRSTTFASEQVIASFLAQEGLELAQKARDELMLEHFSGSRANPWANLRSGASGAPFRWCNTNDGCGLTVANSGATVVERCRSGTINCSLYTSSTTAVTRSHYSHNTNGTLTPYTRIIKFDSTGTPNSEIRVTVTVSWRSGFSREEQQVTAQTSIFNVYGTN